MPLHTTTEKATAPAVRVLPSASEVWPGKEGRKLRVPGDRRGGPEEVHSRHDDVACGERDGARYSTVSTQHSTGWKSSGHGAL